MLTVNDLLTMYVGAASQHALRTTSVPREEAVSFDEKIVAYWSQLDPTLMGATDSLDRHGLLIRRHTHSTWAVTSPPSHACPPNEHTSRPSKTPGRGFAHTWHPENTGQCHSTHHTYTDHGRPR